MRAADNFPKSQSKYRRQVLDYTVGVAFLGTPFRGSWQTGTAALLARIEEARRKGDELTLEFGQYLKLGTREVPSPLGPLVQRFSEMVSEDEFKFDMVCVFETRDTSFEPIAKRAPTLGLDKAGHAIVVDQSSACLDGQDRLGMDSRHNMLHKYNSNESQGFIRITSRLQRFVKGADSVIHRKANARGKSNFQERDWINRKCLQDMRVVDPASMMRKIQAETDTLLHDVYQWVLGTEEYQALIRWQDGQSSSPDDQLIWIEGDSGTGKTMLLMGIICELGTPSPEPSVRPPDIAYYFFRSTGDEPLNTATAALRSLIWMLASQQWRLLSHLREAYDKHGAELFNSDTAFYLLSEVFENMLKDPRLSPVYLVVDALNECNHKTPGLRELLDLVLSSLKLSNKVKWLVSTSWDSVSRQKMRQAPRPALSLTENLLKQPIDIFIQNKVRKLQDKDGYDDKTIAALELMIRARAGGRFQWVALVFRELEPVNGWDAIETVKGLPSGLLEAYDHVFKKTQDRQGRDAERCKTVLSVVYLSYRPPTWAELTVLADLTDIMAPTIVKRCGSFLTTSGETISLWHDSAVTWCRNNHDSKLHPAGVSQGHFDIYNRSIKTLRSALTRNVYALPTAATIPPDRDTYTPNPDPLARIRYSAMFWADHLLDSGLSEDSEVFTFLSKHFLHWIESLTLSRTLSDSSRCLGRMLRQGKVRCGELIEFLKDAEKFLLTYGSLVDRAPLQIYASALIFSPLTSCVRGDKLWNQRLYIQSVSGVRERDVCLQILEGHQKPVHAIAISPPDGALLASGSQDGTVRLWDVTIGKHYKTLKGHKSGVLSVAFSPDGAQVASASADHTVKIWDSRTGDLKQDMEVPGNSSTILSVDFSPNGEQLAISSYDTMIRLCKFRDHESPDSMEERWRSLSGHQAPVFSVMFSPDGETLVSASQDQTIKIWKTSTGLRPKTLKGHTSWVSSIAYSPDAKMIASASHDCTIRLWDAATGASLKKLGSHQAPVFSVAFSPDGKTLASAAQDHTITTWDAKTGRPLRVFKGHVAGVSQVSFLPDGEKLASASYDGSIRIWDLGANPETRQHHDGSVSTVVFSRDGKWLASASHDRTIRLWSATRGCEKILQGHEGPVNTIKFSPDGKVIASASTDGTVRMWSTETGKHRKMHHDYSVTAIAFSVDGKMLASASTGGSVCICDARAKQKKTRNLGKWVSAIAFSPNGKTLALASFDLSIRLWNIDNDTLEMMPPQANSIPVHAIAFSPGGETLAWGSAKGKVWCLDIATHANQQLDHNGSVDSIVFSPDGRYLKTNRTSLKLFADRPGGEDPFKNDYFVDGEWITHGGTPLLFLPKGYSAISAAVYGKTVVLGHESGEITFLNMK